MNISLMKMKRLENGRNNSEAFLMNKQNNILIKNIYYMLSYAFKALQQSNYESVDSEVFENIYDLFAEIVIKGLNKQLKQGLYKI